MNVKSNKRTGTFLALLVVFFWGISFIAIKIVVSVIPPITMGALRFSISWFVLFVISFFLSKGKKLPKKARILSMIAGFWGITIYFMFENLGVHFTTPSQASLLIATVPIFTVIIVDIYRKKRSSSRLYAMSFLSMLGVSVVILSNGFEFSSNVIGDLFILAAAFSWGMYTLYLDRLSEYDNFLATLEMTKWGFFFLIPFSAVEMFFEKANPVSFVRPDVLLWLIFLGSLCSGLGYFMWNYGVRVLGSRVSSNFIYLIPLVSVAADAMMLGNIPPAGVFIGGAIAMIGVVFGERFATLDEVKVSE